MGKSLECRPENSGSVRLPSWVAACLCAAAAVLLPACQVAPGPGGTTARIDELVRAEMERQKFPGVAVGIVKNGEVMMAKGYGFANLEHRVPVGAETIFQSGSIGKMITAAGVMSLVEEGKLALDDSITKHFPEAPAAWKPITVRHMLTHTSGIPDYGEDMLDFRRDYPEEAYAKAALGLKLEFPVGDRFSYSNTAYDLLGIIIHKVSGQFYGDLLRERVFTPLGMSTTRIITEEEIVPNRAAGYRLVKGELKNQEWVSPTLNTYASGSLYVSVLDFIAWAKGVRSGAVLKRESWDRIFEPVKLANGESYPYGFGWRILEMAGQPVHRHGGEWQGFTTHLARYLGDNLTIIVLTNLADAEPERIVDGIAAIMNPALTPPAPEPASEPAAAEPTPAPPAS